MSFSCTTAETFTITHARRLGSKVAADMHICAQYYGHPTEELARAIGEELAQLLKGGYVEQFEFGFEKNEQRVICWRYTISKNVCEKPRHPF